MCLGEFSAERSTCDVGGSNGLVSRAPLDVNTSGIRQVHSAACSGSEPSEAEAKMARLLRTIEGEIVPRLVLARRTAPASSPASSAAGKLPDAADVTEMVRLLLAHDVGVASAYVETIRVRGTSLEAVCLGLLAPAARELGLLWEADECDFMQVTVGLCRLHQLLRELSSEFRCESTQFSTQRNILLSPVPGDQHTFGITLVAQFLRKAGWQVMSDFSGSTEELLEIVRTHWFAAVGFSVGSESRIDRLPRIIQAVRLASNNRSVGILVGGPLLVARPELAATMGADATASDGLSAVQRAEQILGCQRDSMQGPSTDGYDLEYEGL